MHELTIIDYAWNGPITLFVKIKGKDNEQQQNFDSMLRVVDGNVYGDIVKKSTSPLSQSCIDFIKQQIEAKYTAGFFTI